MNTKDKVIHLGKSKSPDHIPLSHSGHPTRLNHAQLPILLNPQKVHVTILNPHHENTQEHDISFPNQGHRFSVTNQCFKGAHFRPHFRDNIFTNQNQNIKPKPTSFPQEVSKCVLSDKISLLELRIKELSEEKQQFQSKCGQQIQKLTVQNSMLRRKLADFEANQKIHQIQDRKNEQSKHLSLQQTQIQCRKLQQEVGMPIVDRNSLLKHTNKQYCYELERQNQNLKRQLQEMSKISIKSNAVKQNSSGWSKASEKDPQQVKIGQDSIDGESRSERMLRAQVAELKQRIEEYVQLVLGKCQQLMKMEDGYKQQLAINANLHTRKCSQFQERINRLCEQLEGEKCRGREAKASSNETCAKCKDFVKALVKLNQKAYTGTIVNY